MDNYYLSLIILFFFTNVFWAAVCSSLINKLMSRNYMDYKIADKLNENNKKPTRPENHTPIYDDLGSMDEVMN